jgi:hypothetical protein
MFRRKSSADQAAPAESELADSLPVVAGNAPKGRPTPKRRTKSSPPAPAPKTRKEAAAWQKQHAAKAKVAGQRKLTPAEYKDAMKAGDPRVLPRRDQGPVRQLTRDYVDSHRMASNYLLLLFPLMFAGFILPLLQLVTLVLFGLLIVEWMVTGTRIRRMAAERGHATRESSVALGFYAGSRAYFPRRTRRPLPRVQLGEQI